MVKAIQYFEVKMRVNFKKNLSILAMLVFASCICIPLVDAWVGPDAWTGIKTKCTDKWENGNIGSVENDPLYPTEVTFDTSVQVCMITNYHWNYGSGTSTTGLI